MKNLSIKLLALVILLLIGGCLYFYTGKSAGTNSPEAANLTLSSDSVKTYVEDHQLFQVNYPKEWTAYKVRAQDTSAGGVNIFPPESIAQYTKNGKLNFDESAYFLPFDQYNGDNPYISIGGQAVYDTYPDRAHFDFKKTSQYQAIMKYVNGWKQGGKFKDLKIEDTNLGGDPAVVITFVDTSKHSKIFYIFKLAKGSITPQAPLTMYYIVQYIAPVDKYSEAIANTLRNSFKDSLDYAIATTPK